MPNCIANTLIPLSANATLVGKLSVGVRCGVGRPLAEAPWQGAGQAVRQRVYLKTHINQRIYVDISNKKLKPGRLWVVTTSHAPPGAVIGDPWVSVNRRMYGQRRYAVAANNNAAQRPAPQPQPEPAAVDPAVAARREELRQRRIRQMAAINARRAERRAAERAAAQNVVGQVAEFAAAAINALVGNGPPPVVRQPDAAHPAPAAPALSLLNMHHETAAITPDCSICCDQLAATVFVGCGHRCACVPCAQRLGSKCPICRKASQAITIYDA